MKVEIIKTRTIITQIGQQHKHLVQEHLKTDQEARVLARVKALEEAAKQLLCKGDSSIYRIRMLKRSFPGGVRVRALSRLLPTKHLSLKKG
jgi:hypothetical protein